MVMTDDPFSDPIAFDDLLNEARGTTMTDDRSGSLDGGTLQTFMAVFLGLPLAVWGGYTLIKDAMETSLEQPRATPLRRRRRKPQEIEAVPIDEPEDGDADEPVPSDGNTDSAPVAVQTDDTEGTVFEEGVQEEAEVVAEIPVHPEISYAQSIELTEYREGAAPSAQTAFVIEATPVGLVAMGYDFEEKRWIYWANLTPHFRVLDAVARMYANVHNRHPLYVPPSVVDAENEAAEAEQEGEQVAQDSKASLFITPTPVGASDVPRPEKRHVANSFKRQGMLSELKFIPEGPREGPKRTSYSDFLAKQQAGH